MCGSYWILGEGFCGAYRTHFSLNLSLQSKGTWYLNYTVYGLLGRLLTTFAATDCLFAP